MSSSTTRKITEDLFTASCNKGWSASSVEEGSIEAAITIRTRLRAAIAIDFATTHHGIHYVDSSGFDHRNGHIHSNDNNWIAKLDAGITREFGLNTQRF